MCYSSRVVADYRKYVRHWGAHLSIEAFYDLYFRQAQGEKLKTPQAMDLAFKASDGADKGEIWPLVAKARERQAHELQAKLEKQTLRQAKARESSAQKPTKAAADSLRISTAQIATLRTRLAELSGEGVASEEGRIFPGTYAPVMVFTEGRLQVLPMRYQCRPAGKPASYDARFPGTYNARLDNLQGFWKGQFGKTHAVVCASAFYEHVPRHLAERRPLSPPDTPQSVVVEFSTQPPQDMLLACLWSRWSAPGEKDLLSFALITSEPPPEVLEVGHDRCVIPLRESNLQTWLNPNPAKLSESYDILNDRRPLVFEHSLAD